MPETVDRKETEDFTKVLEEAHKFVADLQAKRENGEVGEYEYESSFDEKVEEIVQQRLVQAKIDGNGSMQRPVWKSAGDGTTDKTLTLKHEDILNRIRQKAYLGTGPVTGSPTTASPPFFQQFERNIFELIFSMEPVRTNGDSWLINELTKPNFVKRTSIPTNPTYNGALSERTGSIEYFEDRQRFSLASLADVPMLMTRLERAFILGEMENLGKRIFTLLKSDTEYSEITTGKAAALPANDDLLGKLSALSERLDSSYKTPIDGMGAVFVISSAVWNILQQLNSGSGEFAVRPITRNGMGQLSLLQFPLLVSDLLDTGSSAANDVSAIFVNLDSAVEIGIRENLTILKSQHTIQGAESVLGYSRKGVARRDKAGACVLRTKA